MKFKSRWALCSGRHDQVVADGPANSHSPFAGSILKILRTPPRSYVTLNYLLDVVRETTRANYDQLPDGSPLQGVGHERGQYVFRRLGADAETNRWNALRAMPEANQAQISAKKAAISKFCDQFPRSQYLDAAIKMGNELDARERFNSMAQTEFEYRKFIRDFPDSPLIPQVKEKLRLIQKKKPIPLDSPPSAPPAKDNKMYRWLLLLLPMPFLVWIIWPWGENNPGISKIRPNGAGERTEQEIEIPEAPAPDAIAAIADNMVRVSGGTFTMGCTSEQGGDCDSDESPTHQVTLSGYEMGKYEVTQAEWRAVMGTNPSNFSGCDACPVEQVSWNDIQEFLRKLNGMTNGGYRLPTEAEWEYAARGGSSSRGYKYAGGNDLSRVAWYDDNSGNKTHPVGQKQANELGLYDMSGNVWEWCSDWKGTYPSGSQTNPKGPSSGAYRVFRGGSWINDARRCRVSYRNSYDPTFRGHNLGFRLARSSNQ
jgi:formylglycine-generating enzyme required for sulfatase activity